MEPTTSWHNIVAWGKIAEQAEKVSVSKGLELELVDTHKVVWSDIDTNGHVNNVKYAVWALDAVDYETVEKKTLKEMLINYDTEVLKGQEVELYRVTVEEGSDTAVYIVGKVEGKSCFSIKMNF